MKAALKVLQELEKKKYRIIHFSRERFKPASGLMEALSGASCSTLYQTFIMLS